MRGVNELRQNSVTKKTLEEFYALQRSEYQAYVQAENAPIHTTVTKLGQDVALVARDAMEQFDRVGRLESQVEAHMFGSGSASSSGGRPDLHDPARRRVAFIGFNANTTIRDRFAAMDAFMQQHFANIKPIASNLFPDKDGNPTVHGFVEVCSSKQARMIFDTTKSRGLLVPQNAGVRIKPARTEIDTNRVWALREAEGIIKRSPKSSGKSAKLHLW